MESGATTVEWRIDICQKSADHLTHGFPIIWVTHIPNLKGKQLRKICGKKFLETTKYEIRKL